MATTGSQTLDVSGFQVVQFLGSGARSTIWQVREERTGEMRALKRVIKQHTSDHRFLEQARNEFEVGSQFNHAVIRRIYDLRTIKRWMMVREIHMIMELCEGKSVQESRPDNIAETVRIFCEVANGLAHINGRGYVHADIKPNNIIVSPQGAVKIIDLGQSCRLGTIKQRIQGTPDFIAPEQVHRLPLDARTDVFNFGAALYWTLTSRAIPTTLPTKNQVGLIRDIRPPSYYNPAVPSALNQLVIDCIELVPAKRPNSMHEVNSRLTLILKTLQNPAAIRAISLDEEGQGIATAKKDRPIAVDDEDLDLPLDEASFQIPPDDEELRS